MCGRLTILFLLFFCLHARADLKIHTISEQAFNGPINSVSFQQDAITTYKGYQYAVYWSANRHVAVARRSLGAASWQTLELTDYQFEVDNAHYDISLGISPLDGTIHLSFYQWSSVFNYRKSVAGLLNNPNQFAWNSSLFGPIQNGLRDARMGPTTYPRFVTEPSGKLLLLLRHGASGSGDSYLYEYDGSSAQWTQLGQLVDGLATDINAYFNGIHYDANGRLHATWVWRATPDPTTNFDLHYIYSEDDGRTWLNNSGQIVAELGRFPITQNTANTRVWNIEQNRGLINQEAQAVDKDGRVSMLMSHMPDDTPSSTDFAANRLNARVYHYLRKLNGQWQRTQLPGSSFSYDRNKIASDNHNNLYAIINREGIYKATEAQQWQDWTLVQSLTDQSLFAEVQLDRKRLATEGVLSFINISNKGRMLHLEYSDNANTKNPMIVGGGPENYIFCAFEGDYCQPPAGMRDVAFGASGQFKHQTASDGVQCSNSNFEEPIRGTVKQCYYAMDANWQQPGPTGYSLCAQEGQLCQTTGQSQIAYGANGSFHYRLSSTALPCTSSEFGDPIRGTLKQCFIKRQDIAASSSAATASISSIATLSSSSQHSSESSSANISAASSSSAGQTSSQTGNVLAGSIHKLALLCLFIALIVRPFLLGKPCKKLPAKQ
ncbi:BNR repeat-containing protein [Marinagarivorans cellulosilyticus]|uniref:Uncharacterized protein n=1 Tax=Marinagarivorans cellulosilyticus TaxID=2721545 RepID=A0AAN1WIX3_9GAMM|nr:BNR repeat-containing protein [Marinagarivorans cellulosilyticus]BCD98422.1 hypothetical protein MARGE09_P2623 [Marinagarivorans cellulosilyticus]